MNLTEFRSDWGRFDFRLKEYCETHKISKNKLAKAAEMQFTQLQRYYNNTIVRPDLTVLARLCYVLDCSLSDILVYTLPDE